MSKLEFKKATKEMFEDYYYLRCDPHNIRFSGYMKPPEKEHLHEWYLGAIKTEKRIFYLGYDKKGIMSYLYIFPKFEIAEIGIGVHHDRSGLGYEKEVVSFALDLIRGLNIEKAIAWVSKYDISSICSFLENDFLKSETTEDRYINLQPVKYNLYYKNLEVFTNE